MEQKKLFSSQDFNEKYLESYRQNQSDPTNKNHQFDSDSTTATVSNPTPTRVEQPVTSAATELMAFGYPVIDFANTLLPGGAPVGSRHGTALKLAQDLLIICDGNQEAVRQLLLQLSWVKDVVAERGEKEIDDIMDAAKKLMHKRESEYLNALQPSREMRRAIEQLTNRKYNQLVRETHQKMVGNVSGRRTRRSHRIIGAHRARDRKTFSSLSTHQDALLSPEAQALHRCTARGWCFPDDIDDPLLVSVLVGSWPQVPSEQSRGTDRSLRQWQADCR